MTLEERCFVLKKLSCAGSQARIRRSGQKLCFSEEAPQAGRGMPQVMQKAQVQILRGKGRASGHTGVSSRTADGSALHSLPLSLVLSLPFPSPFFFTKRRLLSDIKSMSLRKASRPFNQSSR